MELYKTLQCFFVVVKLLRNILCCLWTHEWASFPAVDSSQLDVGQAHADKYDSQQGHHVPPEAPHGVVDTLLFQEIFP